MGLSVIEIEQVLHTVHETLIAFIYDGMSGIPAIRKTLAAHGLKLNIQFQAGVDCRAVTGERELSDLTLSTVTPNVEEGLHEWRNMGICLDDLREICHGRKLRRLGSCPQIHSFLGNSDRRHRILERFPDGRHACREPYDYVGKDD
jgi:hypothetical protein